MAEGEDWKEDEEWKELIRSYTRFFQFGKSLESGVHAINLALDNISDDEFSLIRNLLKCIADQLEDGPVDKEASMKEIKRIIALLEQSTRKETIRSFFISLSKMPPDPNEECHRPRTV